METKRIVIDPTDIDASAISAAAAIIREGGLVAFPTETVYGLGADALSSQAARKIYAAKGRPSDNPLIVHISRREDLFTVARDIPVWAERLADAFWPGPLTMILWKSDRVPPETTGGMETVAVRMPDHPVALRLIEESGRLIAAPSANTSGRPSPTTAEHVMCDMEGRIPMVLDGGAVGIGIESTIVDLTEQVPMILRPGYITREMLREALGTEVCVDPGIIAADSGQKPKAPGMKYRHYAPRAELVIVEGDTDRVVARINRLAAERQTRGEKTGILATDETRSLYRADYIRSIGARSDEDAIARHLYQLLREFDDLAVDVIYSESFATPRIGHAIMNRLLKAAGHQVITVEKDG